MLAEINSVWKFSSETGLEDGNYRLVAAFPEKEIFIIFNIKKTKEFVRPLLLAFTEFKQFLYAKIIQPVDIPPSPCMLQEEEQMSESSLQLYKSRWQAIEPLVDDKALLLSLATKTKQPKIIEHSKRVELQTKTLYRYLNLYWRHGQSPKALIPNYSSCGEAGKQRNDKTNSLGRKVVSRSGAFPVRESYKVTNRDKDNIISAVTKYHLHPQGATLSQTYKEYLREYFGAVLTNANFNKAIPNVPSLQQFRSWTKKLFDTHEAIRKTKHETNFLTNYKDNESSIVTGYEVPGAVFEIDATVIDVHIVSKWDRNKVLGRPTLYFVVDRASTMTVGFSLSLFYASWDAARLAIYNAFTEKTVFCRENGVDIIDQDWPCSHIPNRLVADNAEMLGLKAEDAMVPMVPLEFSPLGRPDTKPFAEGAFNTLNKQVIHTLLGATKNKDKIIAGAPDPRGKAIYTLEELRTIVLRAIIDKNSQNQKTLARRSRLLIETDSDMTPLGFWQVHVDNYMCALKKASAQEIEARLLRPVRVSVTKNGICFQQIYYSCEKLQKLKLSAIAKSKGHIQLDARVNDDSLDYIFVKFPGEFTYTRCNLLERSKEMSGANIADLYFIQDWIKEKEAKRPVAVSSIESQSIQNIITRHAKSEAKKAPKPKTKKARIENKRENRLIEMIKMRDAAHIEEADQHANLSEQQSAERRQYSNKVETLPKRGDCE